MGERTYEARTVGVDYICDACNTGVMEQTGVMLMTDPPQWPHKCNNCGTATNLWQKYPTVRWERLPTSMLTPNASFSRGP